MKETEILCVDPQEAEEILIKHDPMPCASNEFQSSGVFATNNARTKESTGKKIIKHEIIWYE